eukprot:1962209-Pleurochrysis_carterae.AAC.4
MTRNMMTLLTIVFNSDTVSAPRVLPTFKTLLSGQQQDTSAPNTTSWASRAANNAATAASGVTIAVATATALNSIRKSRTAGAPLHIANASASGAANNSSADNSSQGCFPKSGSRPQASCASDAHHADAIEDENGSDFNETVNAANMDSEINENDVESDDCGSERQEVCEPCDEVGKRRATKKGAGKLWNHTQFSQGTTGAYNWDPENLAAAQAWSCPCKDRVNCIGANRMPNTAVFEVRERFQTTAIHEGGFRDATRKILEQHYSKDTRTFGRSFVVGAKNDCCVASFGLALGLAFSTFAKARADVRMDRAWKEGRRVTREKVESEQMAYIEAHIKDLRDEMEGSKGVSVRTSGTPQRCRLRSGGRHTVKA